MFENLLRNSYIGMTRHVLTDILHRVQAAYDWCRELSFTERELRGMKLLREWLSPHQLVQLNKCGYFDVIGCHTGKQYRIRHGTGANIWELDRYGHPRAGWCFVPNQQLVAGDVMLAQKIGLETDELGALAVAKSFRPIWD